MQQILRLSQLNLFEKRDLMALLRGDSPIEIRTNPAQNSVSVRVNGTVVISYVFIIHLLP